MLSLVKTQIDNWISSGTLKSYINTAKSKMTSAYYPYIRHMWVANLSTTVNGGHVSTYNSRMSSVSSNLALADARLESALNDAIDAVGMIDDLLDLAWTQKARPYSVLYRGIVHCVFLELDPRDGTPTLLFLSVVVIALVLVGVLVVIRFSNP